MTGNAFFTYTQKDLIALIKGDIMAKFGQRELQGIDINCPDIYTCEAVYTPKSIMPEITIKATEELIKEAVPQYGKEKPFRRDNTIFLLDGIEGVKAEYSKTSYTPVLKVSGGPVPMRILTSKKAPDNSKGERGYWIPVAIKPPVNSAQLSRTTGVIPYTLNTIPKGVLITPTTANRGYIIVWLDASAMSADLVINWDASLCPESIHVDMSEVTLKDEDFPRKPSIPTEPKIIIKEKECEHQYGALAENAQIQITCDLNKGK